MTTNMTPQSVDALVQAAIENLQAGRAVEDDAGMELKREWPEPASKARQLAGAANALRGEPLIYVIGVDDKTGEVTTPERREPHEWYAQISARFDQVAPELMGVHTIYIGDGSRSVQAVVFGTADFPYVVNEKNRRDVPIRRGSGTESAHRNQLVRMFEPRLTAPPTSVAEAAAHATWFTSTSDGVISNHLVIQIDARVLIENFGTRPATLPVRNIRARWRWAERSGEFAVSVDHLGSRLFRRAGDPPLPERVAPQFGVYAREGHVIAISPGEFRMHGHTSLDPSDLSAEADTLRKGLRGADELHLDLALRYVGVDSVAKVSATLVRTEPPTAETMGSPESGFQNESLGEWELPDGTEDPWD